MWGASCPQAPSIRHLFLSKERVQKKKERKSTSHRHAAICIFKRVGGQEVCLATPPPEKRRDTGIAGWQREGSHCVGPREHFNSPALYCDAAFQLE